MVNVRDVVTSILFTSTHIDPLPLAAAVQADYVHPCWERVESTFRPAHRDMD
ncbi:MAG: hypothetical protein H7Y09_02210 [Chitinophagaceae bacterium]|nr:hypothetical protein [Anaerolineae bacterium]